MNNRGSLKSDVLWLGILAGLCLLIGVHQIRKAALINPDGVFYISQAQQLAQDSTGVARRCPVGYPFVLWSAHEVATFFTGRDSTMLWLHSALGVTLLCRVLALIPLYFLGKLLVGGENSFWALLILIVLPYPAKYGGDVLREWPYVLFLSLGFWLLYWGLRRRQWWVLALVGLDAGLGYLIRPECVQLVLYALLGLAFLSIAGRRVRTVTLSGAGLLLVAGVLVPMAPYVYATGAIIPHPLRPSVSNAPPIISAIGSKAASDDPLEFEVREGEMLELPIKAADPDEDPLTFSVVGVPLGSRPVYEFWSPSSGDRFWMALESEKNLLLATYSPEVYRYGGIAFYAYTQPDARPGLLLVRRFWLPGQQRHFCTTSEAEVRAIVEESPKGSWNHEGIAFYAFGEDNRPPDTVPVYRFLSRENRYSWTVGDGTQRTEDRRQYRPLLSDSQSDVGRGTVVWYVHVGSEPPFGAVLEGGVFHWRPGPGQKGEYQVNIIVSDGELQSCQLVRIKVTGAPAQGRGADRVPFCAAQSAGLEKPPEAMRRIFAGVAEDLMVVFFVPWLLGLYWRLRYQAERTERVLIVAVVIVNVALMLWRHLGLGPGEDRRYALGMIALTIFYVPIGVEVMARWLNHDHPLPCPRWMPRGLPGLPWFYLLVAVGLVVCLPKLLMASPGNKVGYRAAAAWLQQNTQADDVLAVPDIRISFYAQRQGLFYVQYPNSRRADYVVMINDGEEGQIPLGWRREYSVMVDRRTRKTLVIYSTGRPKR